MPMMQSSHHRRLSSNPHSLLLQNLLTEDPHGTTGRLEEDQEEHDNASVGRQETKFVRKITTSRIVTLNTTFNLLNLGLKILLIFLVFQMITRMDQMDERVGSRFKRSAEYYSSGNSDVTTTDYISKTADILERIEKLNSGLENFTKKIVNNLSDLWRITKSLETSTNTSIESASNKFSHIMTDLSHMNQSLGREIPVVLKALHSSLETQFKELSQKVTDGQNMILVNQNHFRDSCSRIQREEGQVYDEFDARLDIMNSTMFNLMELETRVSERMEKKLLDVYSLMEKTVKFMKQRMNSGLTEDSINGH